MKRNKPLFSAQDMHLYSLDTSKPRKITNPGMILCMSKESGQNKDKI